MKNKGLRPRGRFRIGRAESYGREAGGIHNEPERVSYRRVVSAMRVRDRCDTASHCFRIYQIVVRPCDWQIKTLDERGD